MYSPDNATNFVVMLAKYTQSGNPLFIPEESPGVEGAARSLYAFGRHDAIGYSRMSGGVDRLETPDKDLIGSYDLIAQLTPLILEHQGNGTMSAVLLGPNDPPQKVQAGNYTLEATFLGSRRVGPSATAPETPPRAGAIFIATGPDEYLRGWQRPDRHFFSQHTGAPARRAGHRGRRHLCERPLGSPRAGWPATTP